MDEYFLQDSDQSGDDLDPGIEPMGLAQFGTAHDFHLGYANSESYGHIL